MGLEAGRILSKLSCKKTWKERENWCQSISCLWEREMLSQPSSRQHHMPLPHPGSLLPRLGSPRAASDLDLWNGMEYLECLTVLTLPHVSFAPQAQTPQKNSCT